MQGKNLFVALSAPETSGERQKVLEMQQENGNQENPNLSLPTTKKADSVLNRLLVPYRFKILMTLLSFYDLIAIATKIALTKLSTLSVFQSNKKTLNIKALQNL
jgi:hypothetical protein